MCCVHFEVYFTFTEVPPKVARAKHAARFNVRRSSGVALDCSAPATAVIATTLPQRNTTAPQQPPHHSTHCTWAAFTFEQPPRKTKLAACSWHHDHSQQQEENGELRNISDACIYCIICYLHIFLRGTLMRN